MTVEYCDCAGCQEACNREVQASTARANHPAPPVDPEPQFCPTCGANQTLLWHRLGLPAGTPMVDLAREHLRDCPSCRKALIRCYEPLPDVPGDAGYDWERWHKKKDSLGE